MAQTIIFFSIIIKLTLKLTNIILTHIFSQRTIFDQLIDHIGRREILLRAAHLHDHGLAGERTGDEHDTPADFARERRATDDHVRSVQLDGFHRIDGTRFTSAPAVL